MLDQGRIVQQGTHEQLMREGGTYLRAMSQEVVDAVPTLAAQAAAGGGDA